jgi:iron complex outermembrane receptor protein
LYDDKVFAGIEVLLLSERETIRQTTLPGYGIINLTLFSHELIEGLEISASVYNLLDREFDDPATSFHRQESIEQDGRVFRAKLTYRF